MYYTSTILEHALAGTLEIFIQNGGETEEIISAMKGFFTNYQQLGTDWKLERVLHAVQALCPKHQAKLFSSLNVYEEESAAVVLAKRLFG